MFDIFESMFGTSPSSSTSKVAPEIVPSDTSTKGLTSEKNTIVETKGAVGDRVSRSNNGNSIPRRGRQEDRDRCTHPKTTNATALVVSQSCPPPIYRSGELKPIGYRTSNNTTRRTTSSEISPQHKMGKHSTSATKSSDNRSHRIDEDAHYHRDHSCPPALTVSSNQQQLTPSTTSTAQQLPHNRTKNNNSSGRSMLPNNKKKTKDLVSVTRDRPNRFSSLLLSSRCNK
jgi:hypothetical protein